MEFYSIKRPASGEFRNQGSKFFSYIEPIKNQEIYKHLLSNYKEDNPTACHVCSAYRLYNTDRVDEYASDDGEPNGSSGLPILNQIRQHQCINLAVYVVRIFGGTKLGIPGLIHAYGEATENVFENIKKNIWKPTSIITIKYGYEYTNLIDQLIAQFNAIILKQDFTGTVTTMLKVDSVRKAELNSSLIEKSAGKLQINS